ncbi:uncharacterized mitochondrial protein-like protein [Tanacetum coccineum]
MYVNIGLKYPDFPDRVYKVEKALYRLHQAPRAWYETLSTYLLDNGFKRGKIDKTLFIEAQRFTEVKTASTPMETQKPLLKDKDMCAYDRYQVNPKVSHLHAVKRIFRKSTTGGCQFLRSRLISWQCKKQTVVANSITEAEYVAASSCCGQVLWIQNQLLDYGSKTTAWNEFSSTMASAIICLATNQKFNFSKYIFESMVKNLENMSGKFLMYPRQFSIWVVMKEMDDSLERSATTATSLDAEQDRGNINKTQSKATPNEPSSPGTSSGGGPRRQETMGDTIAQTRFENVSKHSNDPLLARVLALETTKTTQATEIASLKRRVKKLERRNKSRTHGLKRLYKVGSSRRVESSEEESLGDQEDASKQGRIDDIDADAGITLDSTHFDADTDMFEVHDLDGDEVIVDNKDVVTMLRTRKWWLRILAELKSVKPKAVKEQAPTPTVSSQQPSQFKVQDKGKGKMVEPEPVKKMSKKDLLKLDEELAFKLQDEEEEEERLAREKAQQIKEYDDIQAKIKADYYKEENILQLREQKRKETDHQQELKKEYHVYLSEKHGRMEAQKTELVEDNSKKAEAEIEQERSSKRARKELEQESSKKQKVEEDKESKELKGAFLFLVK